MFPPLGPHNPALCGKYPYGPRNVKRLYPWLSTQRAHDLTKKCLFTHCQHLFISSLTLDILPCLPPSIQQLEGAFQTTQQSYLLSCPKLSKKDPPRWLKKGTRRMDWRDGLLVKNMYALAEDWHLVPSTPCSHSSRELDTFF